MDPTELNSVGPFEPQLDYKKAAYKIIAAQLLLTLVIASLLLVTGGVKSAYSALVGGSISVISGFYVAAKLFSFDRYVAPERVLRAFYVGEAVKIFITAVMFGLAIVVLQTDILVLILTYIAALSTYWFALLGTLNIDNTRISDQDRTK